MGGESLTLVLSDRKEHLKAIYESLPAFVQKQTRISTGDLKVAERNENLQLVREGKIRILFATQLGDEGLDIPALSNLVLTFPGKSSIKVIQRLGRIQRVVQGKRSARCYDIVDHEMSLLRHQYAQRHKIYKAQGFRVKNPILGKRIKSVVAYSQEAS